MPTVLLRQAVGGLGLGVARGIPVRGIPVLKLVTREIRALVVDRIHHDLNAFPSLLKDMKIFRKVRKVQGSPARALDQKSTGVGNP